MWWLGITYCLVRLGWGTVGKARVVPRGDTIQSIDYIVTLTISNETSFIACNKSVHKKNSQQ